MYLINVPYIIRVIASLFFILIINRVTRKLSISVLSGIVLLAFWTGRGLSESLYISWERLSSINNIFLVIVVLQVIVLSLQMSYSGSMKDLVGQIRRLTSKRASIALIPAIIGFLPMPGGAAFSAPLVDDCDNEKIIAPMLKTKINYWFRHIWEYWWPLYPGVLLAIDITGLPILTFIMIQLPLSILAVLIGYLFFLRKVKQSKKTARKFKIDDIRKLLSILAPIILIILSYTLIRIFFPQIVEINKYIPMTIGLFLAQIFLQMQRPLDFKKWRSILLSKKIYILIFLVIIIRIYGAFIEVPLPDGSLIVTHIKAELASWKLPVFVIIILIPYISGLTTGLAIGFVGASFPVIMSIIGNASLPILLSTTLLAYTSGYMGMIMSPVHICLILTNEHFKTSLSGSILKLAKPALLMVGIILLVYFYLVYMMPK